MKRKTYSSTCVPKTQMFPGLAARETYVAEAEILRLGSKEMFLNQVENIFCSTDANFASVTYVS